ncbi:MAG: hypothetical protein OXG46_10395, partial [Chloroflexi bacterium]|nr:hypothetical protein [Chloroflexota bacterium]
MEALHRGGAERNVGKQKQPARRLGAQADSHKPLVQWFYRVISTESSFVFAGRIHNPMRYAIKTAMQ